MVVLGIDTSTKTLAVGLWGEGGLVAEITAAAHLTHSERLLVHIIGLLESSGLTLDQVAGIGAVVGPGSFTGLRVGLATAQGLAESRSLPTIGLSSLEVLARGVGVFSGRICPLIVARRGYLYGSIYELQGNRLSVVRETVSCRPEEVISWIEEPTLLLGEGFLAHREFFRSVLQDRLVDAPEHVHRPSGRVVSRRSYEAIVAGRGRDPALLVPQYLGPSTAEINWQLRHTDSRAG